ncbi:mfs transporter : Major facilitator superfamily MFS_1 OS=Pedosphaera parvula (strain Ellin514) GN=Cflav_PD1197 PE=4 SV=1: MFS_1 [Gemmata massiliana]|uniref:Major facilitator superfamily (MFS) profile domain-containing protein n=1 Tax=Gemmata massiliana TaxID=1210884 RepID=A0A6P2CXU5_9BACT|nr:MFS transporter [Gemmata massiliana]VTR92614.1 mfs transporter : Major facilitator superfamily MFS_1 OS=Pedosphaera parvula (strain Ellin514) GN=Cflav_PD1197 PE=4 SV=1: MFS_1 [Gemmata massiliana]
MSSPPPGAIAGLSAVTRWLVVTVAAIGFLFDTYELLMFPVIGAQALSELLKVAPDSDAVRLWSGRMLWIAALAGGVFGLLGGMLIDRLGRKTVMVGSILAYSLSPVAAAYSTELWQLILFRCTTFIGVCVELVAAVTWLAELFTDKRQREMVIGWTLACASLGGIFVTEVFNEIAAFMRLHPEGVSWLPVPPAAWRYTLLTGLIPGALILLLMPFVPESRVWKERKLAGTLKRPSFGELFSPGLRKTTIVTTLLSACGYAAAFGALQLTPLQMTPGLPVLDPIKKEHGPAVKAATGKVKAADEKLAKAESESDKKAASEEKSKAEKGLREAQKPITDEINATRGNIQRWQELGGLTGRILFAILLLYVASRVLIRLFLLPGVVLFPITYLVLYQGEYTIFAAAIFLCGLVTIAQFSYVSEYLPKVFPVHLRGTGSGFATNVGGRMLGTMAATLNTELLAPMLSGEGNPAKVAKAAAIIGAAVYAIALLLSFVLPTPKEETPPAPPAA